MFCAAGFRSIGTVEMTNGLKLPINTSAYDSMTSLHLLDGVIDIYMPDFKLWDSQQSLRYLKAKDYAEMACGVVQEMHRQVGTLKFDEDGLARRGYYWFDTLLCQG